MKANIWRRACAFSFVCLSSSLAVAQAPPSIKLPPPFSPPALNGFGASSAFQMLSSPSDHGRTLGGAGVSPSGAATYSIPIWTPPGPNGVQPAIALTYNSHAGNGLAGMGWNLSAVSSISRCQRTLGQDQTSGAIAMTFADRFCIDGNRLRLSSGTYGAANSVYFTELADYSRITAYSSMGDGPLYFVVEAKSGLKYEYGTSLDAREVPPGSTTVLRWYLSKVSDRNGNNYVLHYTGASGTRLPSTIYWTPTSPGVSTYRYEARFNYNTNRIPIDSKYQGVSGHILVNRGLLKNIQIYSAGVVVRKYVLDHVESLATTRSLLKSVKECADDEENNCFLPITFNYQQEGQAFTGLVAGAGTPPAAGNNGVYAGRYDFNGDGKDDIAYVIGTASWVAFGANGGFTAPFAAGLSGVIGQFLPNGRDAFAGILNGTLHVARWDDASSAFIVHNTGVATSVVGMPIDYNGDGLADLVTKSANSLSLQIRRNTSAETGALSFSNSWQTSAPLSSGWRYVSIVGSSTGLDYTDLNGDGREDLRVQIIWPTENPPAEGEIATTTLLGTASGFQLPAISQWEFNGWGETPSLHFNSDSCTDRFVNDTIQLAPCADDYGMTIYAPAIPKVLMDWDGDGKTDVLADNGGTFWVYRSTGNGFSTLITTNIPSAGTFFVADVDGDGLDDLIRINGTSAISYWTHTAAGSVPTYATNVPDLLSSATDGFGVTHSFNHVSTAWANYDKGTPTSYPIQESGPRIVVARSTSSDGIGGTFNNDFFYVGARRNALRREGLGFQRKDVTDSRNGLISRTTFEQEFPRAGMVKLSELLQPTGPTLISRVETTNTSTPLDSTPGNQRHFVYPVSSTAEQREVGGQLNGVLLKTVSSAFLYEPTSGTLYDRTVTITEEGNANGVSGGGVWVYRTELPLASLLNEPAHWCMGRPRQTRQINYHSLTYGTVTTRSTDTTWNTAYCRPTKIVDELGSGTLEVTTDIGYDAFGNVSSTTVTGAGMAARTTSAVYADATYTTGQFPLSVTNALNQTSDTAWDYDLGVPESATDPNDLTTSWQYDAFGRRTGETRADDTFSTSNVIACSGCGSAYPSLADHIEYSADGTLLHRELVYLDPFDREVARYSSRPDGDYSVTYQGFDSLGNLFWHYFPFLNSTGTTVGYEQINHDLLGRPTSIWRPVSDAGGGFQPTVFSYEGLTTKITDSQEKLTKRVVNAAGQLVRSTDHDNYSQTFDYDAFGNLKRVWDDNAAQPLQSFNYNERGMLTSRTDMDMGPWGFAPNALGETVSQTDAKGQTTTFEFDALGRLKKRIEDAGTSVSTWTWGVPADNTPTNKYVGRLKAVAGPGYTENYLYDHLSRPSRTTIDADQTYHIDYAYNSFSALDTLTYPASTGTLPLKIKYDYTTDALTGIRECANAACDDFGTTYWTANSFNAQGQLTQETLGNNLVTQSDYDKVTGWLKSIKTGQSGGTGIQNLAYTWDLAGNLKTRKDLNQANLTEEFTYDNLYRLKDSTLTGVPSFNIKLEYNALGNIWKKSDVGADEYVYHSTRKHQVTQAGGMSFGYDANGNMTSRGGTAISWTSYNYPLCIREGIDCSGTTSAWSKFDYTPDRQYWRQSSNYPSGGEATTIYVGGILEKVTNNTGTVFRHMIRAGGSTIIVTRDISGTDSVYYLTSDHLGSSSAVTNSNRDILVNSSFDAFGKRRGANWTGSPSSLDWAAIAATTRRGYTEHSMLDNLGLIHMNGRVHDPLLGRFISADPFIPNPMRTQSYNRYSYVQNNPLTMIDPSGFCDTDTADCWVDIRTDTVETCGLFPCFDPTTTFGLGWADAQHAAAKYGTLIGAELFPETANYLTEGQDVSRNWGDRASGVVKGVYKTAVELNEMTLAGMMASYLRPAPAVEISPAESQTAAAVEVLSTVATLGSSLRARAAKTLRAAAGRVFFSGIRGGSERASSWAARNAGKTLNSTLAASGTKLPPWDPNNPASVAAWRQASIEFAKSATGDVRVLQGDALRVDAIWRDEFAALKGNQNVSSITSINPDTGEKVLLWAR